MANIDIVMIKRTRKTGDEDYEQTSRMLDDVLSGPYLYAVVNLT